MINRVKAHRHFPLAATFAVGLCGVTVFKLLNLPLPFLFGTLGACLVAATFGMKLKNPGTISVFARTILGVAVGTSLTPQLMHLVPQMATTLVLVVVYVGVIGIIGVPFFMRLFGFSRATAFFATMPGGFQDMVILGQEAGASPRTLSLVHASRVLVIVTLAPIVLTTMLDARLDHPIGLPISDIPVIELLLMLAVAIIGWKGGEKIRLFGAALLGPLILSAILSLSGFIEHRPPAAALIFAQFFIGLSIGCYYVGITVQELRRDVFAGACFAVVLVVLAAAFSQFAHVYGGAPLREALLSFAPGGQAEMAMLSIIVGADLGFVVLHHLARLVIVLVLAPFAASRLPAENRLDEVAKETASGD